MATRAAELLSGARVAFTGRMEAISRAEAARLVHAHGGELAGRVTRETTHLVVGEGAWPLTPDGHLSHRLRRARALQQRGVPVLITDERQWLKQLGHASPDRIDHCTLGELSRLLHLSHRQLRQWMELGLITHVTQEASEPRFDFTQVSAAKTLASWLTAGVSPARLNRSLRQWARLVPEQRPPLAALDLLRRGGRILYRNARQQLVEPHGQVHFDFEPDQQPLALHSARSESPDEWLARGVRAEADGEPAEAAEAYRHALRLAGPDPHLCFNLANVLLQLDEVERAVERYWQAIELDPVYVEAWNNLGVALGNLEQYAEAEDALRQAIELCPTYADAHYNLADALEQQGRLADARPYWQSYLQFDGASEWAQYARCRLFAPERDCDRP